MKLLWALTFKADSLWVKWVHAYYVKRQDLGDMCAPTKCSWVLKKIFHAREEVDKVGGRSKVMKGAKFSIKQAYSLLRPQGEKVGWSRLLCNNPATPRSLFILWLALHGRLSTTMQLRRWNIDVAGICPVCQNADEVIGHIFFECPTSRDLWSKVLAMLGVQRQVGSWQDEIRHAIKKSRQKHVKSRMYVMCFAEVVYAIWEYRNAVIFRSQVKSVREMYRSVLFRVVCRSHMDVKAMLPNMAIVAV